MGSLDEALYDRRRLQPAGLTLKILEMDLKRLKFLNFRTMIEAVISVGDVPVRTYNHFVSRNYAVEHIIERFVLKCVQIIIRE